MFKDPEAGKIYRRKWLEANRAKVRAQQRARLAARPELRAKRAEWAKRNPEKLKQYRAKAYARMQAAGWHNSLHFKRRYAHVLKGGPVPPKPKVCDCCGMPPAGRSRNTEKLMFEHCHKTNTFRGWVCHMCNKMLADARDSASILRAGARYLTRKH